MYSTNRDQHEIEAQQNIGGQNILLMSMAKSGILAKLKLSTDYEIDPM